MSAFRRRSSARREPSLAAKQLVTGFPASSILHDGRRTVVVLFRASHNPQRFAPGRTLAIRETTSSPIACRVQLTEVRSPFKPERFTLRDVDHGIARELGRLHLRDWRRRFMLNEDQDWLVAAMESGRDTDDDLAERFNSEWVDAHAWLLRFEPLVMMEPPRLLAAGGGCSIREVREAQEAREQFRAPKVTESDRGYTASDSQSLRDAGAALKDEDYAKHVKGWTARQELLCPLPERVERLRARANRRDASLRDEFRRLDWLIARERWHDADAQLRLIERRLQPAAA